MSLLDQLEELSWSYGLLPTETEDWSPGELLSFVQAQRKRDRHQATLLYTHAQLCRAAMDGKMPELWEAFPLWTKQEIYQMKMERIQAKMMKNAKFVTEEVID